MSKELLIKMWNNRNPQYEINSDSGEDMFFDTVKMVFEDYTKALNKPVVSGSCFWDTNGLNGNNTPSQ